MNLNSKRYFSIKEVSKITNISIHRLRYLERSTSKIYQIRGRRYYTIADIDIINQKFGIPNINSDSVLINRVIPVSDLPTKNLISQKNVINKVDKLIAKFISLENKLLVT